MPFRQVAEHLRTQNWAAVAIDFVIVVVGVYIGLQANDWKQQKLERESDQRALALFVDELDVMMVEASDDLNTVTANLEALALGTEIALNCDASMEERRRLATAIANTLVWRIPDIRPSGLAEIGNSGTLHRLGNPELSRQAPARPFQPDGGAEFEIRQQHCPRPIELGPDQVGRVAHPLDLLI